MSSFQDILSRQIITTLTKKPDRPQILIENPLAGNIFCNGIECVLLSEFTRKGELVIEIGNISVFDSRQGSFSGYGKFPVAVGKPMKVNDEIKIFAWNKVDGNAIEVNFNISIGKVLEPINSQAITKDEDLVNKIISESEILFPFRVYTSDESPIVKLVNMKGYKKMILTLAGAGQYIEPTVLFTFPSGTNQVIADGNLTTMLNLNIVDGTLPEVVVGVIDFNNLMIRKAACQYDRTPLNSSIWTMRLYRMDAGNPLDQFDPNWVLVGSRTTTGQIIDVSDNNVRYLMATFQRTGGPLAGANDSFLSELFDANVFGGTAQIDFEIKDIAGNFNILIPASEFDLITEGSAPVVIQIGDTNNVSKTDKVYYLPSTQTDFRAKLTITGTIETGVSIIKVS